MIGNYLIILPFAHILGYYVHNLVGVAVIFLSIKPLYFYN